MLPVLAIAVPATAAIGAALVTKFHLNGPKLKKYDKEPPLFFNSDPASKGVQAVNAYLRENYTAPAKGEDRMQTLIGKRARFDAMADGRDLPAVFQPLLIAADGAPDMDGEWALAEGANPDKRILYIHGGAHTVGSARSHRVITSNLSKLTGCAVCAINYRLLPENKRKDGIADCRNAYRWVLENGPQGESPAQAIAVAGDSAGGNLALSLLNWIKAQGLRAPNCAAALSPQTDATLSAPSIKGNLSTDLMLQSLLGPFLKIPRSALLWAMWKMSGISPAHPDVSPINADLSGLPPVLLQASATEMLYGDSVRYANKSAAAGNDTRLHAWNNMPHVWQIFDQMLPESGDAMLDIANFFGEFGVKG